MGDKMIWLLELPAFFLGVYHTKSIVFASGLAYVLFCLCFRKYAVKEKRCRLHYPLLSITAAVGLAVLFCREWMAYSVPKKLVLIAACLLGFLAIFGIDAALDCLSRETEYRDKIHSSVKKTLQELYARRFTVILPVAVSLLLSNWFVLFYGAQYPDSIWEGVVLYQSNVALSSGRWVIRFLEALSMNLIMPFFSFLVSWAAISGTAILLAKSWEMKRTSSVVLTAVALTVSPAVSFQYLYLYMVIPYAFAMFFAALAVYLCFRFPNTIRCFVLGAISLALSLGTYQSYVGFAAAMIIITLVLKLLDNIPFSEFKKLFLRALLLGITGCCCYLIVLKTMGFLYSTPLSSYGGANSISVFSVLRHLPSTILQAYAEYLFVNLVLPSYPLSVAALVLLCAVFAETLLRLYHSTVMQNWFAAIGLLLLFPLGANMMRMIAFDYAITTPLGIHSFALVFPMILTIFEKTDRHMSMRFCRTLSIGLIAVYAWCCVLFAFATQYSVHHAGQYNISQAQCVLSRVTAMDGYSPDTRIFFAGIPDPEVRKKNNPVLPMTVLPDYSMFWENHSDSLFGWKRFVQHYFGIDTGDFSEQEYYEIIQSEQFQAMDCFPAEGSIAPYGEQVIIVKFQDEPYQGN